MGGASSRADLSHYETVPPYFVPICLNFAGLKSDNNETQRGGNWVKIVPLA